MIAARSTRAFALLLSVLLVACKQGGHDPATDAGSLDKACRWLGTAMPAKERRVFSEDRCGRFRAVSPAG